MKMKLQKAQIVKGILREMKKNGGITFPDFRQYDIATVIKQYSSGTETTQTNGTELKAQR